MRYTIVTSKVQVIGEAWLPSITCAMEYTLGGYELENIRAYGDGEITREAVEHWLSLNAGDFQSVADFRTDISFDDVDIVFEWKNEESECIYNDCMFGDEDEPEPGEYGYEEPALHQIERGEETQS